MQSQFNPDEYIEAYPPGVENTFWHLARCRILETQVAAAGARRILDVGCGCGILVDHLVSRNLDCYGVELGEPSIPAHLKSRISTSVAAADLPREFRESVDTIVLGDVIEHMEEPVEFLRQLRAAFPNLESLLVTVPARAELWSNYDERYRHYRRYDLAMLRADMEASGFAPIELRYMFRALYYPLRLALALRPWRQTKIQPAKKSSLLHRLGGKLLEADFHCLPKTFYGTSALCRSRLVP